MNGLHITKVAVGCGDIDTLARHMAARLEAEGETYIFTRNQPRRASELVGGSIYWIIKHRLMARQGIISFSEAADGEGRIRTRIGLDPAVIAVVPQPRRAHQGWRYLAAADAPADLGGGEGRANALPQELLAELASLRLL